MDIEPCVVPKLKLLAFPILSVTALAVAAVHQANGMTALPNAQMQNVLDRLAVFKNPPLPSLPPLQARQLPDASDAVVVLLSERNQPAKDTSVDVSHTTMAGPGGPIVLRVYKPKDASGTLPVAVYLRGGGWTIANLDTYDASCRALAKMANCMIVSVSYRTSPEAKFPAAHEDAYAAFQYVAKNAASIGGDPSRVAIVGESAGGNMATAVCMMAHDRKGTVPIFQALVYPVTQIGTMTDSMKENTSPMLPLNTATLLWMGKNYMKSPSDAKNKYLSPLNAKDDDLKSMPPATIVLAQDDPLRSEGEMYAAKLKGLSVTVEAKTYDNVTHEFFGMGAAVDEAKQAETQVANGLKGAFAR